MSGSGLNKRLTCATTSGDHLVAVVAFHIPRTGEVINWPKNVGKLGWPSREPDQVWLYAVYNSIDEAFIVGSIPRVSLTKEDKGQA